MISMKSWRRALAPPGSRLPSQDVVRVSMPAKAVERTLSCTARGRSPASFSARVPQAARRRDRHHHNNAENRHRCRRGRCRDRAGDRVRAALSRHGPSSITVRASSIAGEFLVRIIDHTETLRWRSTNSRTYRTRLAARFIP